jgi:hypothetical protein
MNHLAQLGFVKSERIRGIEAPHPAPAKRATALFVQRETAQERRSALDAKIFRCKRLGSGKTRPANRHAREIRQGLIADSAIVGEQKRKKGRGDRLNTERR